jgi:SNF2 family DNA or RNA helicase
METQLWEHQKIAVERAKVMDHFGLFFEPGLGKTFSTISILRNKFNEHKKIFKTLIVAPIIVVQNWKEEWAKFSQVPASQVVMLLGTGKQRIHALEAARGRYNEQVIAITNYEALVSINGLFEYLYAWRPDVVVLDESQRVKNPSSKRTKAAIKLCDNARFKYILSGTPVLNSPMDIFSQYRCLDGGETFGKNFFIFRATYFWDKNSGMPKASYFPLWVPRADTSEKLNALIYTKAMRAVKSECLDLPPFIKKRIYVELSSEQRRLYKEMADDFIAFLNNKTCTAQLAITKMIRLMQILTGFIALEGETHLLKQTPREDALAELLEDLAPNHKVIVWCVFQQNYAQVRRVCEKLGISYVEGHGQIPTKEKYANLVRFDSDDTCRVLIANPRALGIGVNILCASVSIYFSRSHSLEDDIQSAARNYRGGSERHEAVTRIDIVAKDTLDEKILQSLEQKLNVSEEILKWKKDAAFAVK